MILLSHGALEQGQYGEEGVYRRRKPRPMILSEFLNQAALELSELV